MRVLPSENCCVHTSKLRNGMGAMLAAQLTRKMRAVFVLGGETLL